MGLVSSRWLWTIWGESGRVRATQGSGCVSWMDIGDSLYTIPMTPEVYPATVSMAVALLRMFSLPVVCGPLSIANHWYDGMEFVGNGPRAHGLYRAICSGQCLAIPRMVHCGSAARQG